MTKKILVGLTIRFTIMNICAAPVISSFIAAAILNTLYGWDGRAVLVVIAGILWTVANGIAAHWIWDECDIRRVLDSIGSKPEKDSQPREAGAWRA